VEALGGVLGVFGVYYFENFVDEFLLDFLFLSYMLFWIVNISRYIKRGPLIPRPILPKILITPNLNLTTPINRNHPISNLKLSKPLIQIKKSNKRLKQQIQTLLKPQPTINLRQPSYILTNNVILCEIGREIYC
jgi:hypothetical protein